jgi:diguanylate cyclase (GGDEF)-like protein/PAS domain S-box-containing protein
MIVMPSVDRASRSERRLHAFAHALAALVAVAIPLSVFGLRYTALASAVETRLAFKAELVNQMISRSPDMWRFEEHRLTEQLDRLPAELPDEAARVVTTDGQVAAQSAHQLSSFYLERSTALFESGVEVGRVEIRQSVRGLLADTGLAALSGLLLGGLLATLLRRFHQQEQVMRDHLRDQQERASVTLHSIADAVVTTDRDGRVDYLNPVAERLTQWTLDEARGRPLVELCRLIDERTMATIVPPIHQSLRDGLGGSLDVEELALVRRDGTTLAIEESVAPLHGGGGIIGAAWVFRDVTVTRRMAQRIAWAATHDALTGLANRREFDLRVEAAIASARADGRVHAVCYMDLDQFKVVNDTCGHAAGDALLRQVATLLAQRLGRQDTLARLGGDEFGVLLQDCPLERAREVASGLLDVLREFRFPWEGKAFTVSASLGLVVLDAEVRDRADVFSAADTACYSAKEQGRNRLCVFHRSDRDMAQRRTEMDWAGRLTRAMEEDRLCLHYQPYLQLGPEAGGCQHIEMLIRLVDEDGTLVPPGSFLPAAERYNLMPAIDRWVIGTVFSRYHDLIAQMGHPLTCAINLSGTTLNSEGLLDYIRLQAVQHALPRGAVCFEITETAAINNLRLTAQFMTDVKALGFSFALDDFGIGTSSFAYLKTLPVDYLKIDGSFVRNIATDPIDRAMTETINRIGHLMGLQTVGEFAESAEVIGELRALGVDYAQGYGVQRPQALPTPLPIRGSELRRLAGDLAADPALQQGGRPVVHQHLLAPAQVDQVADESV